MQQLKEEKSNFQGKTIWFHSASMGEFEQAKPIIERIKSRNQEIKIVVTFFSPSGYENQKSYTFADAILYIPIDSRSNAKLFIDAFKPDLAVFTRYDAWFNHLKELHKRGISAFLICGTMPPNSPFLWKIFREFTGTLYSYFSHIFTAGSDETAIFQSLKLSSEILTSADTRFDRISYQVALAKQNPILPENTFPKEAIVLVIGSSWKEDEDVFLPAIARLRSEKFDLVRMVIAPHEPTPETIANLLEKLPNSLLLSEIIDNPLGTSTNKTIVVDSIGKLLRLYAHADIAYIGGGFGAGVHSVGEPAGYGIPLASGVRIERARDAVALEKLGALTVVSSSEECYQWLKKMCESKAIRQNIGEISARYVQERIGWSDKITDRIICRISK